MKQSFIRFALATLVFLPTSAFADARVEGAKLCTMQMPKYEREYGIPTHLLSAISSAETGRWHDGLKITLPWPWTINAEGKGYFFDTKQEAIQAAKNLKARGVKSMDLGCMQVNIYHHPNAFRSIEEAFEPQRNIGYAASFLRGLYETEGNWKNAAAAYHSKTPALGSKYLSRVYDKWNTILTRLRMPTSEVQTAALRTNPSMMTKAKMPVKLNRLPESALTKELLPTKTALVEQEGKKLAAHRPVRMKIIEVGKTAKHRENGIIIVRPDVPEPKVIQLASAKPSETTAKRVSILQGAPKSSTGPRFIFND